MHAYDVPRRQPYQPLPSGLPARAPQGGPSATPIYDALYAEYVKSFRALPGDRSGEDELGFTAFGNNPHGPDPFGDQHGRGPYGSQGALDGQASHGSSYGAYSAGAHSARHTTGQFSPWQRVGHIERQSSGTQHVPAALPPGPRRGL